MKPYIWIVSVSMFMCCTCMIAFAQEQEATTVDKTVIETVAQQIKIEKKTIEPFFYCALEMSGSYEQHEIAFDSLYTEAGKQSVNLSQTPFGIYHSDPKLTADEPVIWEVGLIVEKDLEITKPLVKKNWPFRQVASVLYEGEFGNEDYNNLYKKLFAHVYESGCEPAGPVFEKFLSIPVIYPSGGLGGKVEIWLPVQNMKTKEDIKSEQQRDEPDVIKKEVNVEAVKEAEEKQQ